MTAPLASALRRCVGGGPDALRVSGLDALQASGPDALQVGGSNALVAVTAVSVGRVVALASLAFLTTAAVALVYRWYFRERVGVGLSIFAGVSTVAIYLNTKTFFLAVVQNQTDIFQLGNVLFYTGAFAAAAVVSPAGRRAGDRVVVAAVAAFGARELEGEVSKVVRSVGRVIAVELPADVEDIENYDPVADEVKAEVAGKTLLFPRGLTVEELRDRVVNRLKDDYDVGYVDVDVDEDGDISYLALGRRVAGIGPTLGPGMAAVAVTADPPNAASPGDVVQVWRAGETRERVATGEIRGVAGDTVTLALDEQDARAIAGGEYRLLTLPNDPGAERQFASLLRAADETMAAVVVAEASDLDGASVEEADVTVVAVRPPDGPVEPLPPRSRALAAGDTLYLVARPDAIRRVEGLAGQRADASAAGTETA